MDRLQQLIEEGVIDEVFQQLKTGKEAEVWLVSHRGEPVAAKVYKQREFRSFKNDAGYKEGRQVRNSRTQRAMDKGSAFGRASAEEAWKSAEADAMFTLHTSGVRVPRPIVFYDGVLLMEVIGDAEGRVAPRLVEAPLEREQAEPMYRLLRAEVIKMLCADLIHGDLSEFNILLGVDGPVIIDFPQVVTAAKNSQSERYFRRDLGNLLRFFTTHDATVAKHGSDVDEIWRAYVRRELSPTFVPSGRVVQAGPAPTEERRDGRRGGRGRQGQGPKRGRGGQPPRGPGRPADPRGGQPQGTRAAPAGGQPPGTRAAPAGGLPTGQQRPAGSQWPRDGRPQSQQSPRRPEVSYRGGAPASNSPPRDGEPPSNSGRGRRRPKRRF